MAALLSVRPSGWLARHVFKFYLEVPCCVLSFLSIPAFLLCVCGVCVCVLFLRVFCRCFSLSRYFVRSPFPVLPCHGLKEVSNAIVIVCWHANSLRQVSMIAMPEQGMPITHTVCPGTRRGRWPL